MKNKTKNIIKHNVDRSVALIVKSLEKKLSGEELAEAMRYLQDYASNAFDYELDGYKLAMRRAKVTGESSFIVVDAVFCK